MDGLTIRPIRVSDAAELNAMRIMPGVQETISGIYSERVSFSEEYIKNLTPSDYVFIAEVLINGDFNTVGFASISIKDSPQNRHEGVFGVMVRTEWQGMGIGRKLIDKVIDLADNHLNLKRVELVVFADNNDAIRLYESYGFEREALLRANMIRSGSFCDSLIMARIR